MVQEFEEFQVSKEAMSKLKGGVIAACRCAQSNEIFILAGDTMLDVLDDVQQWCGDHNSECVMFCKLNFRYEKQIFEI